MVDIDRSELDKPTINGLINVKIHEDLAVFIPFLLEKTEKWEPKIEHHGWLGWCREKVDRYPVVSGNPHTEHYLNPYKFIHDFSKEWEEDDIIVTGNGSACVIPFQCAEIKPNQRLYTNSGDASMGYDLPAAIGAAIANPDKRIICLAGDGSIMMNLQELQTIQTLNLNIKIIVLNNNGYLSIKQTQKNYFSDCEFGTEPGNGVGFPKFARVGESFDINSVIVRNITDWKSSYVKQLLTSDNPALIEVMIDPNQQFAPKLMAKKLADGSMLAPSLENMFPFLSDEEMRENMIGDDA
jgi:acetolactate synthase-1/2/3 large subunit